MRDHRSIIAWQEARAVAGASIRLARDAWKPFASAVFGQLQRAALSVQLNIAEGYAYGPGKRFRSHLAIAYGSAIEAADLLELAIEEQLIDARQGAEALNRCRRTQALLLGLMKRYRQA